MKANYDFAIVGSGFSGSLMAMVLHQLGFSVILLERGKHPRFAIGESSTPLTNLFLEQLATKYKLDRLLPLCKWGSWQSTYPQIGCGLKRGFSFFHHSRGEHYQYDPERSKELLVAASPHDGIADTHWYRSDFDAFLVDEAINLGIEYIDELTLDTVEIKNQLVILSGSKKQKPIELSCSFLIDATGPRGFLFRKLQLQEKRWQNLPRTEGLYSHFVEVNKLSEMGVHPNGEEPPYAIDDAALHHVFKEGWIWVLRFNNGITSAGVAATQEFANKLQFAEGENSWRKVLDCFPTIKSQFESAKSILPLIHHKELSFCCKSVVGERWALLPSAAGFIDPLLSTGFPLTLSGILHLAEIITGSWETDDFQNGLQNYENRTLNNLTVAENLVGALYKNMNDFALFSKLSLLYFSAASFMESAHRLNKPELATSFLLNEHPSFGQALKDCCHEAMSNLQPSERQNLFLNVEAAIEPFNIAGLGDPNRRNWYAVLAEDLLTGSEKLNSSRADIEALLERTNYRPLQGLNGGLKSSRCQT